MTRLTALLPLLLLPACVALPPLPFGDAAVVEPEPPPPLPPAVVAALPPGAPQSTVIQNGDGCYLFSIERTEPPTGYLIRDAAGNPICEGGLSAGPIARTGIVAPAAPLQ